MKGKVVLGRLNALIGRTKVIDWGDDCVIIELINQSIKGRRGTLASKAFGERARMVCRWRCTSSACSIVFMQDRQEQSSQNIAASSAQGG